MLKICLTGGGYTADHFNALQAHGFNVSHHAEHLLPEDLQRLLPEFDAYVLGGDERLRKQELKIAKKLELSLAWFRVRHSEHMIVWETQFSEIYANDTNSQICLPCLNMIKRRANC